MPSTSATESAAPLATQRWLYDSVFGVWKEAYGPVGLYFSKTALQAKVKPGKPFPPTREVADQAQAFSPVDEALAGFKAHFTGRHKCEVWF